jgi:hypothetical protein
MKFFNELRRDLIEEAHIKAESSLSESRIDIQSFRSLYGDKNVEKDIKHTEQLKNDFLQNNTPEEIEAKKLATIFEAIINEQLELSDWLGPNVFTAVTTEYDDYINKIDTIVEFNEEGRLMSHLGLAIDATYSTMMLKKFKQIKDDIKKGTLSSIKYFKSLNMDFTGRLSKIPRVIISAEPETIKNLAKIWIEGRKKELAEHPIQFQIIDEILIQLETFEKYANSIGQKELAEKYNTLNNILVKIFNSKQKNIKDTGEIDNMFDLILSYIEKFDEIK